jgi:hypothetical protein
MDPKENTSTAAPLLCACSLPSNGCKQTLPLLTLLTHSVHVTIFSSLLNSFFCTTLSISFSQFCTSMAAVFLSFISTPPVYLLVYVGLFLSSRLPPWCHCELWKWMTQASCPSTLLPSLLYSAQQFVSLLVDFLPRQETVSVAHYVQVHQKLWHALHNKSPWKDTLFFSIIIHAVTVHT